ncbi:MAG: c-type cytochrome [Gemmataceae bacterium]|nr:c-type cytochrome [Gemmataceae bacterium]
MIHFRLCVVLGLAIVLATLAPGEGVQQKGGKKGGAKEDPKHDPANAVANLDVHQDLRATLSASEPTLTNPTNLDIDHRGRLWVCDVMNYRGNNGKRPEGDRILILEDTDGDGVMDRSKVFYQGRDIDSAMGICVLGDRLIVSASPSVFVFTFDPATDRILKKDVLFTKTGQPQHDHSAHSFVFGPDGRLYWNFGNTGQRVHDRSGKPVIDLAGNPVVDNGRPYYGGMVFRCEMDGTNFEVLGHNFRNNYEVAVDSFGTLWQSDNDDDGNRGVRINYVMEFGNYGYRDEMTGAGWKTPRTNLEADIPQQHWHLNDPGVVPNLLQTGQGSPTGICVYEGKLLPPVFRGQVIHCDAGPSVTRAYPVEADGAGYRAKVVNILDGNKKNNWFRPADACVAPDGSLFVTDWYDPGVGGHAQRDINRGRIFRVAPPGTQYTTPRFDFTTAAGAAAALKNPNLAVRYLAWTTLHRLGKAAEGELLRLWQSKEPRERARALWLLGRIEGRGPHYVDVALGDSDANLRVVGLRLARQLKLDLLPLVARVVKDASAQVRRDAAVALRHLKEPRAAELWAELALRHDGKDRWYLEALGIAADQQWDAFLAAWLAKVGPQATKTAAGRDLLWRSRAAQTPQYLARIIGDPATKADELPRYFRALDFLTGASKQEILVKLLSTELKGDAARKGVILVESVRRLKQVDLAKQPQLAAALERVLAQTPGTQTYVDVVSQFGLTKHYPTLLALAQQHPDQQLGVNAVRALLERGQATLIRAALDAKDVKAAQATLLALMTAADARTNPVLLPLVRDRKRDVEQRRQAVRAVAKTRGGAQTLLRLTREKKFGEELKQAIGAALTVAPWKDVKAQAAELFPLPPGKGDRPLPPFADLLRMRGTVARGKEVFRAAGTCANCHQVNGEGKDVGPDLSEIGKKLSREAVLEAILYPSAAISHNYETWVVETKAGAVETGLLASDAADAVALKGADGILRTFKRAEVDQMRKTPVSLMPADLHKALTPQDLADVVDYLLTLREARVTRGAKK